MQLAIPGPLVLDHPTAQQVIEREGLTDKLADKVMLVTGASSGIGIDTARALYHTGAHVFLAVRDTAKTQQVKADIEADGLAGKGVIELLHLDMTSLDSVRQCAKDVLSKSKQLHVLICNAGVMATPEGRTKDGFETQFGVNHVAHFLLFHLLKDALLASSTAEFNSRVVVVSSNGHTRSPVVFDNLSMEKGYDKFLAYAVSKTANVHMALEIDRRYGIHGLHATAVHPGAVVHTGLGKELSADDFASITKQRTGMALVVKTQGQGAATTVWAAVAKEWEGRGGKYLEDVSISVPQTEESHSMFRGYAPHTYDQQQAERLWNVSLSLVGVKDSRSS